jgi:quercetin dioxygenase-like cupin family protein
LITTLFQKPSGKITMISAANGEGLTETTSAFDLFAQIVAGEADLMINGTVHKLKKGNSIIIPAHACHAVKSVGKFRMILTVLKCGYE